MSSPQASVRPGATSARTTRIPTVAGDAEVRFYPASGAVGLIVLTHGSAGGVEAPDLAALRDAAALRQWTVVAVTQPFRLAGRRSPGRPEMQDAAWVEIVTRVRRRRPGPLVLAGRSNGARVACRTAGGLGAAGVVALAFPLHPPGHPERSRLAELERATVPVLVVQGERDPFGVPPAAPGRDVVVVPGSDHSLRRGAPVVASAAGALLDVLAERLG